MRGIVTLVCVGYLHYGFVFQNASKFVSIWVQLTIFVYSARFSVKREIDAPIVFPLVFRFEQSYLSDLS